MTTMQLSDKSQVSILSKAWPVDLESRRSKKNISNAPLNKNYFQTETDDLGHFNLMRIFYPTGNSKRVTNKTLKKY